MTPEKKHILLKDSCERLVYGLFAWYNSTSGYIKGYEEAEFTIIIDAIDINKQLITYRPYFEDEGIISSNTVSGARMFNDRKDKVFIKPYLRSLSSMTKQEALELAELSGFKNILSVKVNQDHIVVEVDDGVCSSERHIIWFNEIVSSIGILDWLLKNHFDFRGLIELGLALPVLEGLYK